MPTSERLRELIALAGLWLQAIVLLAVGVFCLVASGYVIPIVCTKIIKVLAH